MKPVIDKDTEVWLQESLSRCLDFNVPEDMIQLILKLKTPKELDEYLDSLLNKENDDHVRFITDCHKRIFAKQLQNKKIQSEEMKSKKPIGQGTGTIKQNHMAREAETAKTNTLPQSGKKKTKFTRVYTNDGDFVMEKILLKGRRLCDCQASDHELVNNCQECGRIVCEQEGSGPCLFCGNIVCTTEEMQLIRSNSKKGDILLKKIQGKGGGESLRKALEQRDRLLEYDRNSEKRTTVIDDEFDYFEENSVWLNDSEREKIERLKKDIYEAKHASRVNRKIKVDFAGREIEDEPELSEEYLQSQLKQIHSTKPNEDEKKYYTKDNKDDGTVDPNIESSRPIYKLSKSDKSKGSTVPIHNGFERVYNIVQDKELLEMQDMRSCLSLHQPWASLLIMGIKRYEGRSWYTKHRGRLWIASTSKKPLEEDIKELESFYKDIYKDQNINFPKDYPTSCLLGCVRIDDCLPQEEYREKYPISESDSPYVFICSNPEPLKVVFPIKGQPKIYEIDPKIHFAACKALMHQNKN